MFLQENTFVESALEAEFKVDLDLSGAPGLGLEVDWADGKTLLIKSIKASGEWFGEVGVGVGWVGWVGWVGMGGLGGLGGLGFSMKSL